MAYTPRHYYRGKDDLDRGDPNKRVKGAELSDEFEAISSDLRKVHQELAAEGGDLEGIHVEIDGIHVEIDGINAEIGGINTEIGNINTNIDGINAEIEVIKDDITGLEESIVWVQTPVDPDTGDGGEIKPKKNNEVHAQAFVGDGSQLSGIKMDQLADVNADSPTRDDLLIWNGSNWVADDFAFIETALRFKGGIDMTGAAPVSPGNGDLYINDTAGVIDASWGVLAGINVGEGKFVGWAEAKGRWFLLGDMADVGVTNVSPGLGIDVDDTVPSEPVVSIDRTEVDTWYASYNHNHDGIYEPAFTKNTAFNKNFGTTAGTVAEGNHTHSQYLTSYTETDPVFNAHVSSGITQSDIDKWNASASATAPVVSVNSKTGAVVLTASDVGAEPAFAKNTAFNKNFGTAAGTVAQGNHTHSNYAASNHNHSGVYEPVINPKNTAFNKAFGTASGTVAQGNHNHDGVYLKSFTETDPTVGAHIKGITQADIDRWNNPPSGGSTYASDNGITVDNSANKIRWSGSYTGQATIAESVNPDALWSGKNGLIVQAEGANPIGGVIASGSGGATYVGGFTTETVQLSQYESIHYLVFFTHNTPGSSINQCRAATLDSHGNWVTNGGARTVKGGELISTKDMISILSKLRNATKKKKTFEELRDAMSEAVEGLLEEYEASFNKTKDIGI